MRRQEKDYSWKKIKSGCLRCKNLLHKKLLNNQECSTLTRQNLFPLMFMIGISVIPVLSIHMPRMLSFLPLVFGLIMSTWWVFEEKKKLVFSKTYIKSVLAIGLLCVVSVLWSLSPWEAYKKSLVIFGILAASIPLSGLALSVDRERLKPFLWLFPAAITFAALLCSVDLFFDLPLYKMTRGIAFETEQATAVMNRGIICTVFSYVISFLFLQHMHNEKLKLALKVMMTIGVIVMLLLTQSQSAQLAFIIAVLMMFLFPAKHSVAFKGLTVLVVLAFMLSPWIVQVAYASLFENVQSIAWLKQGYAAHRLEIWNFVTEYAMQSPLYGHGLEAARYIQLVDHDFVYQRDTKILHPHNFSIQLWLEFGVLGALLGAAICGIILEHINRLTLMDKKPVTALFISVLVVASLTYGLWQSWWLGEFVFITFLCMTLSRSNSS